jgi:Skp family chaperone for outer membrane proteins
MILVLLIAAVPASAGKIGFVDAQQVIGQVEEGKVRLAELQAWQAPHQARLDSLRDQVLALSDQINSQRATATPEAISEIERNQLEVMRRFEDARREYERELEQQKNRVLAAITKKIAAIGAEYAEANDYDAVFLLGEQPLVYLAESANLTGKIIEIYNERFPVNGQ